MKSITKELWFNTQKPREFINITGEVEALLRESGIQEGLCLANAMHITASVFINDDESGLHHDFDVWLEKLAPHEPVSSYLHNSGEINADAQVKIPTFYNFLILLSSRNRFISNNQISELLWLVAERHKLKRKRRIA